MRPTLRTRRLLSLALRPAAALALRPAAALAQAAAPPPPPPASTAAPPPPAPAAATLAGTGPGLRWNRTARLGYEYRHSKAVAALAEGFWVRSRHELDAVDAGRFASVRGAVGADIGLLFTM